MTKPKFPDTHISSSHPDFATLARVRDGIFEKIGGESELREQLPQLIKNAVDFVLDPERTFRTSMLELDKVEKTFIGLKIEHYLRDWIGCPKGLKRDTRIADVDVDIKNTIGSTWMIPLETYGKAEPCILIATAKFDGRCWLGIMVARPEYLNAENRDKKRSVSEAGKRNIMWLVRDEPYPPSRWQGIDTAAFKEFRSTLKSGNKRAAAFFKHHLGKVVHRTILEALLNDQKDFSRRLRADNAAASGLRKVLADQGISLLCGTWPDDKKAASAAGVEELGADEWLAVRKL